MWSIINVLVDFSRGGIECRWCACLWAGTRKAPLPLPLGAPLCTAEDEAWRVSAVEERWAMLYWLKPLVLVPASARMPYAGPCSALAMALDRVGDAGGGAVSSGGEGILVEAKKQSDPGFALVNLTSILFVTFGLIRTIAVLRHRLRSRQRPAAGGVLDVVDVAVKVCDSRWHSRGRATETLGVSRMDAIAVLPLVWNVSLS